MNLEIRPGRTAAEIEEGARRAAAVLRDGGLLIYPTETVYGLGGTASTETNELIARVKGRVGNQPLLMLTPDLVTLRQHLVGLEWPGTAEALARHFWPGPLTLVVPCRGAPAGFAGPDSGVAVRISPHPFVAAIFRYHRGPITSTSVNRSGGKPAQTVREALELLDARPDLEDIDRVLLAVDGGRTEGGSPSSIVSCVDSPPRVLREGLIRREAILRVLTEPRQP